LFRIRLPLQKSFF